MKRQFDLVTKKVEDWPPAKRAWAEDAGLPPPELYPPMPECKPPRRGSPPHESVVEVWGPKDKKVTLYIGESSAFYIKVWGPDMHSEMEDGELESLDFLYELFTWLREGDEATD